MPRIRTIKPEFWVSAQVIECSTNARLLFIGLWNFCDDKGRHPLSAKQCKAEVFPADPFSINEIEDMLAELIEHDLIVPYSHENNRFFYIPGWHHQKIDKPQKPKYPDPFDEHSTNIRRTFATDRIGKEGIGEERILEESKDSSCADEASPPTAKVEELPEAEQPCGLVFAMQNGSYHMTKGRLAEYVSTYKFDVRAELMKASLWLRDNKPRRPRTKTSCKKFLTRWLNRRDESRKPSEQLSGKVANDAQVRSEKRRNDLIRKFLREGFDKATAIAEADRELRRLLGKSTLEGNVKESAATG